MILTDEQVKLRFENPDKRIEEAKKLHKKQIMHVHGVGVTEYLTHIEGLENQSKINLRRKLARSNKSLFADLLRSTDKVFKAKGGSKYYDLPKNKEKDFTDKLSNVSQGLSLSKWLENYWLDKYVTDENSLIFVEHKDNVAYPTYKSILTIRDYVQKGQDVEYVIFEPHIEDKEKDVKYFRMYDDSGDYIFMLKGKTFTRLENTKEEKFRFEYPWGYVPAKITSDLIDPLTEFKKSAINEQIELADEYLRENSIKTLYKYHHGFPLFWQYAPTCQSCGGSGEIIKDGNESGQTYNAQCHACHGTGYNYKKDVSDVTWVSPPEDKEQPVITELAGYIVPPIDSLTMMTDELSLLRRLIIYSHWGVENNEEKNVQTATEIERNLEPMEDRLNKYSNSLEIIETGITNILGEYYYGESYKGSSIHKGRNYIVKSVNILTEEYKALKSSKAGLNLLNKKLKEIVHAKYQNDPTNLLINLKLIQVEPMVHNTIGESKTIGTYDMYTQKLYYNDWLTTKADEDLIKQEVKDLKEELKLFTKESISNENVQEVQSDSDEKVFQ